MTAFDPASELFVARGFLDQPLCRQLRDEVAAGASTKASIINEEGAIVLDERTRRTLRVDPVGRLRCIVEEKLLDVIPQMARHFGACLTGIQRPQYLMYRRGCFFRMHQDNWPALHFDPEIAERRVSAVLFLNRQTPLPEPDAFCGGQLRLFFPHRATDPRMDLCGEEGLLVAFRAETLHEVRPVTQGIRYSIVTWFRGPPGK